ncbi:MAG: PspA/IM30 family protein [Pseudomonadota bacterium]|nr:PspA/IM30 family protein [Pseudomonadota bacterium]
MSILKRLSTTLVSRIDSVVNEIENHDAVVQATLNDMRKKVAVAKVRLNRVHQDEERLKNQILEQKERARQWRNRAIECAKSDEGRALKCVCHSRQCEQKINRHQQALLQYQQTAEKLAANIEFSEQRLTEIKQKLTLMRARQSTSSALRATCDSSPCATQLLDDTFDRWEINISHDEMAIDSQQMVDPMEREFILNEQEDELRSELQSLLKKEEK